jgi:transketolase
MSLSPLKIKSNLAPAPSAAPLYGVSIKNKQGQPVLCGDPKATRALLALMNMHAVIGGAACHWGGPSALAEMMSALHAYMFQKKDWMNSFNFINDVGHGENGIYALRANLSYGDLTFKRLRGFRSIESNLTGHGEEHLNPEGVLLSNGPLGSALPQAQGLAMADKITGNERITFCVVSDGASMEGEAKEAFAAIPGFAQKNKINPFIMIISDNNTKLSGRIDQDSFEMGPTFNSLQDLGWKVITVQEGHSLEACYHATQDAVKLSADFPAICIRLKTIKGKGIKATEESSSGGHGYPLKAYDEKLLSFLEEIYQGASVPEEFKSWAQELMLKPEAGSAAGAATEKMQKGIANALITAATKGIPVYSLSSDLQGSTGVKDFQSKFPTHYTDLGIAESNMVSVAAGFSKAGYIPVVDTFAAFGVTKGNLPLIMSSLSNCPMIAIFSHTGFQDAADGASHQSLTYFSALSSIPHVRCVSVSTSSEAEALLTQAIDEIYQSKLNSTQGYSYIFFVGRENFVASITSEAPLLGKPQLIKKGKEALVVATGPAIHQALMVDKDIAIINLSSINFGDLDLIVETLKTCGNKLITVEDHQVIGGMGAQLVHRLKMQGVEFSLKALGVQGEFGRSSYTAQELYDHYSIGAEAITKAVQSFPLG